MTKIETALTELEAKSPFLANIVNRLGIERDDKGASAAGPTIFTNGEAIYWNGDFVDNATPDVVTVAIAYCVCSLLFQHGARRGDRRVFEWQAASSSLIMQMLEDIGFTIPDICYRAIEVDAQNDTIEEVYDRIMAQDTDSTFRYEDIAEIRDAILEQAIADTDIDGIEVAEERVMLDSNWPKVFTLLSPEEIERFKQGRTL